MEENKEISFWIIYNIPVLQSPPPTSANRSLILTLFFNKHIVGKRENLSFCWCWWHIIEYSGFFWQAKSDIAWMCSITLDKLTAYEWQIHVTLVYQTTFVTQLWHSHYINAVTPSHPVTKDDYQSVSKMYITSIDCYNKFTWTQNHDNYERVILQGSRLTHTQHFIPNK